MFTDMRKISRSIQRSSQQRSARRWAAVLASAVAPLLTVPAHAQTAPGAMAAEYAGLGAASAYAFQDSRGGSSLSRITQSQGAGSSLPAATPQPAAAPAAPAAVVPAAVVDGGLKALASWSSAPVRVEPAIARAPDRIGRTIGAEPSVFGSVALRVSHTAMDARWEHAAFAAPPTDARWRQMVATASAAPDHARLAMVNAWINHAVTFTSDMQNYGVSDYWASARETMARGRGDCEDYAIAKMQLLREAGVPSANLYLVVARDLVRRADHALLLVRLDDGYWVLDSGGDEVAPAEAVADYRPLVTFSIGKEWVHGIRRAPQPLVLASAAQVSPSDGRR
jgi:predicted transglutaminase-like cysteine proteinase